VRLIESFSLKLATTIKNTDPNRIKTSVEVMQFALISLIGHLITFVVSLGIAAITGTFTETLICLVSVILLRWFTGGFHFRSPELCSIVSVLVVVIIPFINLSDLVSISLILFSLIMILVFAPVGSNHSSILEERHRPLLKIIGLSIVASNFLWMNDNLSLVFFFQTVSFIPLLLERR